MPSGNGGMGRGSDTRIYAPRSESNHMYSNNDEDSYRHGIGDKEEFERKRDEKMREKEETKTVGDTPHLRIEIDKPEEEPMMEDMGSPQEEENPDMYNPEQAAAQTDMSSMAGPIGIGGPNLSQAIGAQTNGVMQQFATGEPMDLAFRLLKATERCYTCQGSGEITVPFDPNTAPITCTNCGGSGVIRSKHPGSEDEGQGQVRYQTVGSAPVEGMKLEQGILVPHTYNAPAMFNTRKDSDKPRLSETPTFAGTPFGGMFTTSEPMADAWSTLMKNEPGPPPKKDSETMDEYMQRISGPFGALPTPPRQVTAAPYIQKPKVQSFDPQFQQKNTSELMDGAWSTLMKARDQSWQQPKYDGPPGGRKPHIATSIRSKRQSRTLSPRTEHGGLTEAPLAVEMGHLGLSTKQPLRLFPGKYRQQLGQRHQRALMGNISMPHQPHNIEQRTPTAPGPMGSGKIPRLAGEMAAVKSRPKAVAKSELQEMGMLLKSAKDYLHISQLRRIIRDMKKIVERQDRMKKGSNKNKKAGHRGESTNPQGATDDPESDEMSSSGMPGHVFAARGSGRVA